MSEFLASLVLVVGIPLNLFVALRLWRLAGKSPNRVLRHAAISATAVLLLVVVFGFIFANNDLDVPFLAGEATRLITRWAVLAVAVVPAVYWAWVYR